MSETSPHVVLEDCLAWSTTVKKGQLITDANAKPTALAKGERVALVGPALEVEPKTVFVTRGETTLEVRLRFLGPA